MRHPTAFLTLLSLLASPAYAVTVGCDQINAITENCYQSTKPKGNSDRELAASASAQKSCVAGAVTAAERAENHGQPVPKLSWEQAARKYQHCPGAQ